MGIPRVKCESHGFPLPPSPVLEARSHCRDLHQLCVCLHPVPHSSPWRLPSAPVSGRLLPCDTGSLHGTSSSSLLHSHSPALLLYMGRTKLSHSPVRQTDSSDSKRQKKKGKKATIFDLLIARQLAGFCTPFFPCLSSSMCPAFSIDVNIKLWKVELPYAEFILLSIFRTHEK